MVMTTKRFPWKGPLTLILSLVVLVGFLWVRRSARPAYRTEEGQSAKRAESGPAQERTGFVPGSAVSLPPIDVINAEQGEFRLPFLGLVKARVRPEKLTMPSRSAGSFTFPLRVYYSDKGEFLRAEYEKPGARDYRTSMENLEIMYQQTVEAITGLPEEPLKIGLAKIVEGTGLNLEAATRFDVNYVMFSSNREPAKPTLLVNIYGVDSMVSFRAPPGEEFLRVRAVLNEQGEILWLDNTL
jgi:hypothetical protein